MELVNREKIQKIKTALSSVIERYVAGEEVRIWYSYNPDELCGMYWLMKQLRALNCQTTIYLVKLPAWEYGKENTVTSKIAWGEVSPGEWGNYTGRTKGRNNLSPYIAKKDGINTEKSLRPSY